MKKSLFVSIVCAIALLTGCGKQSTQVVTNGIGEFSVSANKKVTFSPGNLQYHPAHDVWRFAEQQIDYIGQDNKYISTQYNGWIDLFGWSTNCSKNTQWGVSSSSDNKEEYSGRFVDWGKNEISGDAPNTWRTLTKDEWKYLIYTRDNASSLCGIAQVDGVNGFILLPDNWQSNIRIRNGVLREYTEHFSKCQSFTKGQWAKLEQLGAVFLPAAGDRYETEYNWVSESYRTDIYGKYWSASKSSECLTWSEKRIVGDMAAYFVFQSNGVGIAEHTCVYGLAVRLVHDL